MQLQIEEIRKYFGDVRANDGISLTLQPGMIYGLLGENGAGKSTLMKVLSGYHKPDSGKIALDEEGVRFDSPAEALASGIGMIYQDPLDVPSMRILDNYLLGRDHKLLLDRKSALLELRETAERVGFEVDPQAFIDTLTLGERQQLELLRLLAMGAEVLILDEPTTGISGEQKEELFDSIRKLAKSEGKTVILVSHKLAEVQELCDHVFVLRKGKLVGEIGIPYQTEELVRMMFEDVPPRTPRVAQVRHEKALQLQNVAIEGERLQVEDLDFAVQSGEVFGLAGLEGSGQRLLLKACAGLIHPSRGKILLDGKDVTRFHFHRMRMQGVAYLPAGRLEEGLVAGLSLTEHIALATMDRDFLIDWKRYTEETRKRIDRYQIVGQPETHVDELSGGNQQRALFALLRSPLQLLLLEHPTRGLDVRSADWIWQLLMQRVEDGAAILFISADLDELIERSDRIAAFSGGRMSRIVQAQATTAEELGYLIGGER
ncbi:MAG: ATP-binding cassette domain-containing protein [Anaerolineales bacterium]|jgi:simple sugar transport system ATP-binding protein